MTESNFTNGTSSPGDSVGDDSFSDPVERCVAEAIRRHAAEGDAAIERVCSESPEHADAVRRRLESLRELGLFGSVEERTAFGPYRLVRELGAGGMGRVYLAIDDRLGRPVALKVLRGALEFSERARSRFRREIDAIARLSDPRVVPIYDVAEEDGSPYFVMEYVEGASLADWIQAARAERASDDPWIAAWNRMSSEGQHECVAGFPWMDVDSERRRHAIPALLCVDLALGLEHVHSAGLVHRDVKPSNALVRGDDGRAQLCDFGLASMEDSNTLTHTGDFLGTPQYVSPEQIRGSIHELDRRTDVYSLGVTLYELLTLEVPFDGPTTHHVFRAIERGEPVAPRKHDASIPKDLETICTVAMDRDPERRYRTAAELAADLERFLDGRSIQARPLPWTARAARYVARNAWQLSAAAALILALAGGLFATRTALAREQEAATLAESRLVETERLSDALVLGELFDEAERLYPPVPESVGELQSWVARATALVDRLPIHEQFARDWEQRYLGGEPPADGVGLPDEIAIPEQWRYRTALSVLSETERLTPVFDDIRERLDFARHIGGLSILDEREAWTRCIAEVASDSQYAGLALAPQLGLVPMGADPVSGLQEFWHIATGTRPERDAQSGSLVCGEDTGLVFVLLPGAQYPMGTHRNLPAGQGMPRVDPYASTSEQPVKTIPLDAFFMSKFELTQGQWLRITGSNPSAYRPIIPIPDDWKVITLAHPVEGVTWIEADQWMGRLGLVLPTEAQWEYAARGGTSTVWCTGDERESIQGYANLADVTIHNMGTESNPRLELWLDDGYITHAPAGTYRANGYGLHETMGNISEWVRDQFCPYRVEPELEGERSCGEENRVIRGGGYGSYADHARSATRRAHPQRSTWNDLGVRPARRVDATYAGLDWEQLEPLLRAAAAADGR